MSTLVLALVIVVAAIVIVTGGVAAAVAVLRRTAAQMGRRVEAGRDASLQHAVDQLLTHSRTVLGSERELGAAELDARRAVFDDQIARMHQRIGEFERTVRESQ